MTFSSLSMMRVVRNAMYALGVIVGSFLAVLALGLVLGGTANAAPVHHSDDNAPSAEDRGAKQEKTKGTSRQVTVFVDRDGSRVVTNRIVVARPSRSAVADSNSSSSKPGRRSGTRPVAQSTRPAKSRTSTGRVSRPANSPLVRNRFVDYWKPAAASTTPRRDNTTAPKTTAPKSVSTGSTAAKKRARVATAKTTDAPATGTSGMRTTTRTTSVARPAKPTAKRPGMVTPERPRTNSQPTMESAPAGTDTVTTTGRVATTKEQPSSRGGESDDDSGFIVATGKKIAKVDDAISTRKEVGAEIDKKISGNRRSAAELRERTRLAAPGSPERAVLREWRTKNAGDYLKNTRDREGLRRPVRATMAAAAAAARDNARVVASTRVGRKLAPSAGGVGRKLAPAASAVGGGARTVTSSVGRVLAPVGQRIGSGLDRVDTATQAPRTKMTKVGRAVSTEAGRLRSVVGGHLSTAGGLGQDAGRAVTGAASRIPGAKPMASSARKAAAPLAKVARSKPAAVAGRAGAKAGKTLAKTVGKRAALLDLGIAGYETYRDVRSGKPLKKAAVKRFVPTVSGMAASAVVIGAFGPGAPVVVGAVVVGAGVEWAVEHREEIGRTVKAADRAVSRAKKAAVDKGVQGGKDAVREGASAVRSGATAVRSGATAARSGATMLRKEGQQTVGRVADRAVSTATDKARSAAATATTAASTVKDTATSTQATVSSAATSAASTVQNTVTDAGRDVAQAAGGAAGAVGNAVDNAADRAQDLAGGAAKKIGGGVSRLSRAFGL